MKHRFHRLQSTSSLHGSTNHQPPAAPPDTSLPPAAAEDGEEHPDKGPLYDPKQEVFVSLFVRPMLLLCFFSFLLVLIAVPLPGLGLLWALKLLFNSVYYYVCHANDGMCSLTNPICGCGLQMNLIVLRVSVLCGDPRARAENPTAVLVL